MHRAFVLAGLLAAFAAAPARADESGMTPAISQCLHDNAAKVEAAEPDLTKATDYLVANACALPIAAEQKRLTDVRIQALRQRNLQQCEDRVAQQKKNETLNNPRYATTRTYENCAAMSNLMLDSSRYSFVSLSGLGPKPAAAVSMASKLILDLRVAHNKTRQ
jgi:hypothetical protein